MPIDFESCHVDGQQHCQWEKALVQYEHFTSSNLDKTRETLLMTFNDKTDIRNGNFFKNCLKLFSALLITDWKHTDKIIKKKNKQQRKLLNV